MSILRQFWTLRPKIRNIRAFYSNINAFYFSESGPDNFYETLIKEKKQEKAKVLDDGK